MCIWDLGDTNCSLGFHYGFSASLVPSPRNDVFGSGFTLVVVVKGLFFCKVGKSNCSLKLQAYLAVATMNSQTQRANNPRRAAAKRGRLACD